MSRLGVNGNGGASIYVQDLSRFYEELGATLALVTSVKESEGLSDALRSRMIDEVRKIIARERPTLIHVLYWKSASVVLGVPECIGIRKVFSPISLEAGKRKGSEGADSDVERWKIEKDIMRQSDVTAVVSSQEEAIARDEYGIPADKIHVVMRSVDLDSFSPSEPGRRTDRVVRAFRDKYILFVGRFAPSKGLDSLIEVYLSLALETETPPPLVLAGGSSRDILSLQNDMRKTLDRIERSGGRIEFVGHIGQESLPDLYRGALVTCVPSRYEPGSRVMLESMSCGTPVLTTETGYMHELVSAKLDPAPGWAVGLHEDCGKWLSVLPT